MALSLPKIFSQYDTSKILFLSPTKLLLEDSSVDHTEDLGRWRKLLLISSSIWVVPRQFNWCMYSLADFDQNIRGRSIHPVTNRKWSESVFYFLLHIRKLKILSYEFEQLHNYNKTHKKESYWNFKTRSNGRNKVKCVGLNIKQTSSRLSLFNVGR